ncbi:MAG: VWA domain-containing protein [Bacteroidales bacterium]|nr:MAG: VWA domain-containing protein [Bacteroidales bacterium]
MKPYKLKRLLIFYSGAVLFLSTTTLVAQQPNTKPPLTRILFVFDCSQSMAGLWESDKKINIARNFLMNTIDSLEKLDNIQMALRVYGHQSVVPPQDCSDTRLEVPFASNNGSRIRQKLRYLNPKGTTPIANSLRLSANDFPQCETCRNVIILITDGIEACDGDPCAVSNELQRAGIVFKPFVIGIGLDPRFRKTFECVGYYYNAAEEKRFRDVLGIVVSQVLNSTTVQVNLLDSEGNPSETNVNMTFYDREHESIKHNFIHTINNRGNPDTIILDPLVTYRLVVHTIPPVNLDSINLIKGKHNIIALDAPQGYLRVEPSGGSQYRDLRFIVREAGKNATLNMQGINTTEKYITGSYDLEIPTLPRIIMKDINILQSHTTSIKIPRPGIVTLQISNEGYCGLFVQKNNELEWIYNVNTSNRSESIVLLPGTYRAVYRARNAKRSYYSIEKTFTIESGKSIYIRML